MADIRRLPNPVAEVWDWQLHGSCRGESTSLFFHPDGERGPARARRQTAAKAVCARCPVIDACLKLALAVREPYGVWGTPDTRPGQRPVPAPPQERGTSRSGHPAGRRPVGTSPVPRRRRREQR